MATAQRIDRGQDPIRFVLNRKDTNGFLDQHLWPATECQSLFQEKVHPAVHLPDEPCELGAAINLGSLPSPVRGPSCQHVPGLSADQLLQSDRKARVRSPCCSVALGPAELRLPELLPEPCATGWMPMALRLGTSTTL
jgi:hypothetical protein